MVKVNRVKWYVILNNVLYTPRLHSDLIFVSKLVSKEADVDFTKKDADVIISDNYSIMLVI